MTGFANRQSLFFCAIIDIMNIKYLGEKMYISDAKNFSIDETLDCGQTFRWRKDGKGFYGVALGKKVRAEQHGSDITIYGAGLGEGWENYFDLNRDYGAIKKHYSKDEFLKQGMEYAGGIRVLRQPEFETLISFIISANNNVKRIMGIVEKVCKKYGTQIDEDVYDFPTPTQLASATEEELVECGAGYRAAYILKTARIIESGFPLFELRDMPYEEARVRLTELSGVGMKVADCVCLYSLSFTQSFPADVWMKRVLCGAYGYTGKNDKTMREFIDNEFGEHAGIAQQYLFHYARHNPQTVCKVGE